MFMHQWIILTVGFSGKRRGESIDLHLDLSEQEMLQLSRNDITTDSNTNPSDDIKKPWYSAGNCLLSLQNVGFTTLTARYGLSMHYLYEILLELLPI